jgi:hypothetical protein
MPLLFETVEEDDGDTKDPDQEEEDKINEEYVDGVDAVGPVPRFDGRA